MSLKLESYKENVFNETRDIVLKDFLKRIGSEDSARNKEFLALGAKKVCYIFFTKEVEEYIDKKSCKCESCHKDAMFEAVQKVVVSKVFEILRIHTISFDQLPCRCCASYG